LIGRQAVIDILVQLISPKTPVTDYPSTLHIIGRFFFFLVETGIGKEFYTKLCESHTHHVFFKMQVSAH